MYKKTSLFFLFFFTLSGVNAQQNRITYELGVNYGFHRLEKVKNIKSYPNSFENIYDITSLQLDNRWSFNNLKRTQNPNNLYFWLSKFNWQDNYIKSFSKKLDGYFCLSGTGRNFILSEYSLDLGTAEPIGLYANRIALNYYVLSTSYYFQSKSKRGYIGALGVGFSQAVKTNIQNGFYFDGGRYLFCPTLNLALQKFIVKKVYIKLDYNQGFTPLFRDKIFSQNPLLPQPQGFSTYLLSKGSNFGVRVGFVPNLTDRNKEQKTKRNEKIQNNPSN
jgi:hypothetical protein